jgi:hypothetical protein
MAWVAVDIDGSEYMYNYKPVRILKYKNWYNRTVCNAKHIKLPKGTIEKLIGIKLTWDNDCIKLK